ncbi:ribonuclease P protein component 4 [Geoglobus sp.]
MAVKRDKALEKRIARGRIDFLLNLADEVKFRDYELARRYVELAVKIAKKYRIRLKKKKLRFCRKCMHPYRHDRMRVRVSKGVVRITCMNCGNIRRFRIK